MKNTTLSLVALVALAATSVSGAFDASKGVGRMHHARMSSHNANRLGALLRRDGPGKTGYCAAQRASAASSSSSSSASETPTPTPKPKPKPVVKVEPAPTPIEKPKPADTPAPKPKHQSDNSGGSGGGGGKTYTGADVTFYTPGENACGGFDGPSSRIAAIAYGTWNSMPGWNGNSNDNPLCGRQIEVHCNGKSTVAKVTDLCAGCGISTSVDLSPDCFNDLADPSVGRLHDCTWNFV